MIDNTTLEDLQKNLWDIQNKPLNRFLDRLCKGNPNNAIVRFKYVKTLPKNPKDFENVIFITNEGAETRRHVFLDGEWELFN